MSVLCDILCLVVYNWSIVLCLFIDVSILCVVFSCAVLCLVNRHNRLYQTTSNIAVLLLFVTFRNNNLCRIVLHWVQKAANMSK